MAETRKINLGISVDEQHRGLKNLDFFADHISFINDMRCIPKVSTEMGTLYLRAALTNITCPHCKGHVRRNIKNPLAEWFLKFSGRKILYCTSCDWKQIVKEGEWQWEVLAAVLATFSIICFASVYWILR